MISLEEKRNLGLNLRALRIKMKKNLNILLDLKIKVEEVKIELFKLKIIWKCTRTIFLNFNVINFFY
jgi:hypothetical protein